MGPENIKRHFILIFFLFLLTEASLGSGGDEEDVYSSPLWDRYKKSFQLPDTINEPPDFKFLFGFDSRISFVFNKNTKLSGIKIGIEGDGKHRAGFGFYSLKNPVILKDKPLVIDSGSYFNGTDSVRYPIVDTFNLRTHYSYLSVFVEPIWISNKKWELTSPFQLGLGEAKIDYRNNSGVVKDLVKFPFLVTEVSVVGHYKFFPWVGLGAGIGYRAMITSNQDVKDAFNAPIYIIKLKIFLGDLYRGIFKKKDQE